MSDFDWENDDFEPPSVDDAVGGTAQQWSDEEEEESEDEQTTKPTATTTAANPATRKKKKGLKQILKEKEEQRQREAEERQRRLAEEATVDPVAEKLRRQRLVEEADFENTKDLFGVGGEEDGEGEESLDGMMPETASEYVQFKDRLVGKLNSLDQSSPDYMFFLEELLRDVCSGMTVDETRRLSKVLTVLVNEKQKAEKASRGGGGKKKSNKPTIAKDHSRFDDYDDDMADFM